MLEGFKRRFEWRYPAALGLRNLARGLGFGVLPGKLLLSVKPSCFPGYLWRFACRRICEELQHRGAHNRLRGGDTSLLLHFVLPQPVKYGEELSWAFLTVLARCLPTLGV